MSKPRIKTVYRIACDEGPGHVAEVAGRLFRVRTWGRKDISRGNGLVGRLAKAMKCEASRAYPGDGSSPHMVCKRAISKKNVNKIAAAVCKR